MAPEAFQNPPTNQRPTGTLPPSTTHGLVKPRLHKDILSHSPNGFALGKIQPFPGFEEMGGTLVTGLVGA